MNEQWKKMNVYVENKMAFVECLKIEHYIIIDPSLF